MRVRPLSLRRALRNLIDNADRYGPPGQHLQLEARAHDGMWQIALRDEGPGIPEIEMENMKRPFARLDAARGNSQGAGLGLAIVDRVARAHDGRFELANHPDGGLIATLSLPSAATNTTQSG